MGSITPDYKVEDRNNLTIIKIRNLKNVKLSSITLKTDSTFKRNVTVDGKVSKMLYNLEFENTKYNDLTIPLDWYRVSADTFDITIDNKDDKPINIQGIEAKYFADELIFDGSKSKGYTLRFGNNEALTPKSYDISNYKDQIINEGYDILSINKINMESTKIPLMPQKDYRLVFNIVISAVAIVMGIIVFLKLKK